MKSGRVLTGAHPDGKLRTDAGWFRAGREPLTRTGFALPYWHKPRAHRAVINIIVVAAVIEALWGLLAHRVVTEDVLAAVVFLYLLRLAYRRLARRRHASWLVPLHLAAHELVGIPRAAAASSWIKDLTIEDRSVTSVRLEVPPNWPADPKDEERLIDLATKKLAIGAVDHEWRRAGPKPQLTLRRSVPPPSRVTLADLRDAIDQAGTDDLVWGHGQKKSVVSTSLADDSPHVGCSMGSGAGKSACVRCLVAQRLYKGDIALILDVKMISHQWAEGLPNAHIARRPHEIHAALMWLGEEVQRRNEVALAGADIDGNVHSVVGPRLIVACEELNATMKALRRYWQQAGGEGRSPALDALDFTSFCGRQVLVNVIYVGQRLSVKAIGGDGDARENIGVVAFGRYTASNWKMLAGDHPMPPSQRKPGRIQVVTDSVRETQGLFMWPREARALAVAGTVTPLPAGMPGAVSGTSPRTQISSPDLGVVSGTSAPLGHRGSLVRLSDAVTEGVVSLGLHALRKASQRDKDFPARKGLDGTAALYDAAELKEWEAAR